MTTVEPIRNKDEIKKVEKILAHQSQRDLVLFTLGINSGLRISDILALNVGDVRMKTYIMRKTFGYHHYKKFRDLALLQKIFNHSNPQVTLRYIGIEQDQIEDSYTNFVL